MIKCTCRGGVGRYAVFHILASTILILGFAVSSLSGWSQIAGMAPRDVRQVRLSVDGNLYGECAAALGPRVVAQLETEIFRESTRALKAQFSHLQIASKPIGENAQCSITLDKYVMNITVECSWADGIGEVLNLGRVRKLGFARMA